jgi:hypothetical protein
MAQSRHEGAGNLETARAQLLALFLAGTLGTLSPQAARADQGGVSFWLPGTFGSLAATPLTPGWSFTSIYLHSGVEAGGNVAASRTINFPNRSVNLNVNLDARLDAQIDIGFLAPTYVFPTSVLGGQFSMTVLVPYGRSAASIDATLAGSLGPIGFTVERSVSDERTVFGDIFFQPMLRWNQGVNNYLIYAMANLPIGAYDSTRLANLGLGHAGIDAGAGYTYFNPQSGWEFSVVGGLTYNFRNIEIDYQNGIDAHLDWGLSHFVAKQVHVGLVGYAYQQLTPDTGSRATLGDFRSRVFGIGPQVGLLFPVGEMQGYLNLKGYGEFGAQNRPEGWNAWVTFAISPKPPTHEPLPRRLVTK